VRHDNRTEITEQERRHHLARRRAKWEGRQAYLDGIPPEQNPYMGWQKREGGIDSEQAIMWARWLLGWLVASEARRKETQ